MQRIDDRLLKLPTLSQVETSAGFGDNWAHTFRSSDHAVSGYVLDVLFPLIEQAGAFAGYWSQRIGIAVKVRKDIGGLLKVSVPVQAPSY